MDKEINCVDCIHGLVCGIECKDDCRHYLNKTTAAPAYVGQPIYRIKGNWGYEDNDTLHEDYKILNWYIVEGKVSMIQQKADKSWKIRMSEGGSVSDYTIGDVGKWVFFDKEAAEKKAEEKTNGLSGL
jgi:hypothetical protein